MSDIKLPPLMKETQHIAMYIAMVVRNAMEDFHCKHLSDEQMKELNPIVRNAVCSALHALHNYEQDAEARKFVDFQFSLIPRYWEMPELPTSYVQLWEREE